VTNADVLTVPQDQRPQRAMEAVATALLTRTDAWVDGELRQDSLTVQGADGWSFRLEREYNHHGGDAGAILRYADKAGVRWGYCGLWNGMGVATQLRDAWRAREDQEAAKDVAQDVAAMLEAIGAPQVELQPIHEPVKKATPSYRKKEAAK
jgi:hypothetical protein